MFTYRGIEIHVAAEQDNSYAYWAFIPSEGILTFEWLEEATAFIDMIVNQATA